MKTKMKWLSMLLMGIVCLGQMTGLLYAQADTKAPKGIVILPETFLRGYDPVTVFFDQAYGPQKGGPLDVPGEFLRITPQQAGEYKWLDAKTLQFLPAVPWAPLSRFEIKAKTEAKALVTMMIPPSKVSPSSGSTNLGRFDKILLTFSQYIDLERLRDTISFEVKPLPGLDSQESVWLTGRDFSLKALDRVKTSDPYVYQLTMNTLFDYGKRVIIHIKLCLDGTIPGSAARYTFDTKQLFVVRGMGTGSVNYPVASNGSVYTMDQAVNCGTGRNPLFIEFTENLSELPIATVKKFVHFEPVVRNLTHKVSGNRLYLYFDVDRNTPYQLSLSYTDITSQNGRTLGLFGDTSFYFYFTQLDPYLKWSQGKGIVECYGPQFFPMEGRAMEKIDLRIYKIDPLNRNFWPFPNTPVGLDEESRPFMPGEEPDYGTQMTEQIKLLGTPQISQVVHLPITEKSPGSRFGIDLKPFFAKVSGPDKPGTYLVGYRVPGASTQRSYVRIMVTDLCLSTVEEEHGINFIVTSLKTGQPVSGARIELECDFSGTWRSVLSGITDSTGQYHYEHKKELQLLEGISSSIKRITVARDADVLVLNPAEPPSYFMDNHWFSEGSAWFDWLSYKPRNDQSQPARKGFIVTERPVYKPDEPVHLIGYVRLRQQGWIIADDTNRKREVIINGPGEKSWSYPLELKSLGHFYLKFDEKDLPTGRYVAHLMDMADHTELASVPFQKEAYRVPTFEINLSGPDKAPLDQVFTVTLTAKYYAGGIVAGQNVTWEITQYPYQVRPTSLKGFIFSSDERFSQGHGYYNYGSSTQQAVTDENGSATLTLNPAAEDDSLPRRYVIEATVRGADTQTVTTTKTVYALPAFTIGLKAPSFIKDEKIIRPEVVVMRHDETIMPGKRVQVRLYQRQWHSYLTESDFTTGTTKYSSDVVDTLLSQQDYTTTSQPLQLNLPVKDSGVYVVEVLGWDNLGRMQKVQADLYVAGQDPVTWKKTQANIFETTLDKKRYAPGDTVTMLLKSPFQQAQALVIMETPRGNRYYWINIINGQGIFTFEVEKDMCPSLPIHTLLMRGRIDGTGKQEAWRDDRGKPISMANTTWIQVDPVENQAIVTLEHERTHLPGGRMKMKIRMVDRWGKPLNGEAALWLVDKAVLSLGEEQFKDPLGNFIDPVQSLLKLRDIRNDIVGNLSVEEIPGSSGEDYEPDKLLSLLERSTIRKNFRTVAYYNDSIPVKNGVAELDIDLPENLTDFAVRCIAISDYDRFGIAASTISIRLPVIVQPALPRFVRPGDEFVAGGIARTVEGNGGASIYQVKVDGLKIRQEDGVLAQTAAGNINLEKNLPKQVYFPMLVPTSDLTDKKSVNITLAVERNADKANDGFAIDLPVRYYMEKSRIEYFTDITGKELLVLPYISEKYRPGSIKRVVLITTEPGMIRMLNGMEFIANYQYGCTEQRISKALPILALRGLFKTLELDREIAYDKQQFASLLTYLETTMHANGLYSFWPGSEPYVSLTAYVVEFLALAKEAGYTFKNQLLEQPMSALRAALRSDYDGFISGNEFMERVEALVALDAAGSFDSSYAFDLVVAARNSDLYSKARILNLFLKRGYKGNQDVKELLKDVWKSVTFKMGTDKKEIFEGFQTGKYSWNGLTLTSETRTLAAVTRALYRAEPNNPKVRLLIDEIIRRAGTDGWGNTTDNTACLITLGEIIGQDAKSAKSYAFELQIDNKTNKIDTRGRKLWFYRDNENSRGVLRNKTPGEKEMPSVYMFSDYEPVRDLDKVAQQNEGFVVSREHFEYDADNTLKQRRKIEAGKNYQYAIDTVVEEHVQIINSQTRNFVAIRIPFAAGFEPLNPQLAGAPKEAQPAGELTLQPSYCSYEDDQITYYYDTLPSGTYDFYVRLRASFAGSYIQPPSYAELLYNFKIKGKSNGARITLVDKTDKVDKADKAK